MLGYREIIRPEHDISSVGALIRVGDAVVVKIGCALRRIGQNVVLVEKLFGGVIQTQEMPRLVKSEFGSGSRKKFIRTVTRCGTVNQNPVVLAFNTQSGRQPTGNADQTTAPEAAEALKKKQIYPISVAHRDQSCSVNIVKVTAHLVEAWVADNSHRIYVDGDVAGVCHLSKLRENQRQVAAVD